ncbi:hypothetical protein K227x_46130 [Rubripirellula lacrimiformis]|uniref:BioF2-like acetyltransferase domain-containing protein n=1 Tax=Rubripirellula lacrimiformis TaxID=1930273 RepID=A0A517NGE0_9BACT|nr:GNAT family N-acetyltransferase [Rubripirellula lacrimiformis]QDT06205.1 hypothetical protein K227x_46130 [Rubripirellula lacrimiformis]
MTVLPLAREFTIRSSADHESACRVDQVQVVPWGGLSDADRLRWRQLRATQSELRTPFFSLAFFDAVQASRGDVLCAVMRSGGQVVGFLPFHRINHIAWPAGRFVNDAHNVVAHPDTTFDWCWLLKECQVKAYDFHSMVGSMSNIEQVSFQGITESFRADLGNDSKQFLAGLEKQHKTIRRQEQKSRKLAREIGPISIEIDCRDPSILQQMIAWKRDQYRRTNILDLFTPEWTRNMVDQLHRSNGPDTRGLLSVLRAGDTIVAAHFGMLENGLLHYWFPTYDTAFSRYSPGTALFKEIIRVADRHGIRCIDMGYGEQPYKRKQTDTITTVKHGCVTPSSVYRNMRAMRLAATNVIKQFPMKTQLKQVLRTVQPNAGISKLQ